MKTPSPLLFASTALTMALALPAFAASPSEGSGSGLFSSARSATMPGNDDANPPLIRVSDDEDDDDDHRGWERRGHDDDDDECEDGRCRGAGGRGNPSPVGTVAPPANGLFGNGALPKAVTN